jgi:hypothetical protein
MDEMSVCNTVSKDYDSAQKYRHTNVEQNGSIFLLVDDVVLKNLVVQGLGWFHCRRHGELCLCSTRLLDGMVCLQEEVRQEGRQSREK